MLLLNSITYVCLFNKSNMFRWLSRLDLRAHPTSNIFQKKDFHIFNSFISIALSDISFHFDLNDPVPFFQAYMPRPMCHKPLISSDT